MDKVQFSLKSIFDVLQCWLCGQPGQDFWIFGLIYCWAFLSMSVSFGLARLLLLPISLYGHARRLSSLGCISGLYVDLNLLEYEVCGPCPLTTPYRKGSYLRTPRIAREPVVLHIFLHLQLVAFKWASFTSGFTLNAIHYKVDPTSNIWEGSWICVVSE